MILHSGKECILRTPHRMTETTAPDARSVHQGDPTTKKGPVSSQIVGSSDLSYPKNILSSFSLFSYKEAHEFD